MRRAHMRCFSVGTSMYNASFNSGIDQTIYQVRPISTCAIACSHAQLTRAPTGLLWRCTSGRGSNSCVWSGSFHSVPKIDAAPPAARAP